MVSFRGQNLLKPRPDWSPLGVKFKISDEHPRLFHMGVHPPGPPPDNYRTVPKLSFCLKRKRNEGEEKRMQSETLLQMVLLKAST